MRGPVGRWARLPPAPLTPRIHHVAVWSGTELLIWGGSSDPGAAPRSDTELLRRTGHADGARYDPATRTWSQVAPSPLSPREQAAGVWTGNELVVVGGADGGGVLADAAAYDPVMDSWRDLPPMPISPRSAPGIGWNGRQVIVVGGTDLYGALSDGAAYDPVEDRWRPLPTPPVVIGGDELQVVAHDGGAVVSGFQALNFDGVDALRYDDRLEAWLQLPALPNGRFAAAALADADGRLLALAPPDPIVRTSGTHLIELRDGADSWTVRALAPVEGSPGIAGIWAGESYLILPGASSRGFLWRSSRDSWFSLPPTPDAGEPGVTSTWAGDRLLVWGGSEPTGAELLELEP